MTNWLAGALAECTLTEEAEGYLLGRGAKEESYKAMSVVTWRPTPEPVDDVSFVKRYGNHGEKLDGYLIFPVLSPKGKLIGMEARSIRKKDISEFLLPEAAWCPVWLGLTPEAMQRIYDGADVTVTEGVFDKYPMEWVRPEEVILASLRAKLTDKHVEFLRRFCIGWVNMCYDLDEQGRKATHGWVAQNGKRRWGALDQLRRVGLSCRDLLYSGAKDPGQLWDNGGVEALRAAFT